MQMALSNANPPHPTTQNAPEAMGDDGGFDLAAELLKLDLDAEVYSG